MIEKDVYWLIRVIIIFSHSRMSAIILWWILKDEATPCITLKELTFYFGSSTRMSLLKLKLISFKLKFINTYQKKKKLKLIKLISFQIYPYFTLNLKLEKLLKSLKQVVLVEIYFNPRVVWFHKWTLLETMSIWASLTRWTA